jgi:hypothetical protein
MREFMPREQPILSITQNTSEAIRSARITSETAQRMLHPHVVKLAIFGFTSLW